MARKRNCVLGVAAALLAAHAFAASSQASDAKGSCLVTGTAKMVDKVELGRGVWFVDGEGRYVFRGFATCVGLVKGTPAAAALGVVSGGYYHNIVCGTGKAVKTANSLTAVFADTANKGFAFWSGVVASFDYAVEFVVTHGVLYADQAPGGTKDIPMDLKPFDDPKPGNPSAGYDPAGFVWLTAPAVAELAKPGGGEPNPLTGECTKAFDVSASFVYDS